MRINHNIASLNTYRQLSSNGVNTQKSLEKLSSGLRINKAGDDAAGLAISEKMRAQIRGLDQASRNAQDSISMIQTAEGALSETHSILQRMRELATQAANDTNVSIDRTSIQKEINQLSSEINRIGNTTEFNTQKVLDGGRQIKTNATASFAHLQGGSAAALSNAGAGGATGTNAVATKWNTGDLTLVADVANGETVTFGGVTITFNVAAADATHVAGAATLQGFTGTTARIDMVTGDASLQDEVTVRNAIVNALNNVKGVAGSPVSGFTFGTSGTSGITATDTLAHGATNNGFAFVEGFAGGGNVFANVGGVAQEAAGVGGAVGVTGVAATSTMTFTAASEEGSSIVMLDKKISFWDSGSGNFADATAAKEALGADYVVDVAGVVGATAMATKVFTTIGANGIGGATLSDNGAGMITLTANTTGLFQGHNRSMEISPATVADATGSLTFTNKPAEGSSITIGDKKIGFYDSSLGNYATDAAAKTGLGTDFVVDVKDLTAEKVTDAILNLQTDLNSALSKDVDLAKTVNSDGSVTLNVTAQTSGFGGNTIALGVSKDTTAGFTANFQIGANTAQSMTAEISDMRAGALNVTGNVAGSSIVAENGAKAYYTSTATVSDGTTNKNVEYSLDVSSHDKATAAISVINDAIETVSGERSKLGAYQNRLEHTINNLGTSSENLTAAESRIRDVDMAKEMMEFTKNNILSQAAQAMLAQANQQPQGVLQLLR